MTLNNDNSEDVDQEKKNLRSYFHSCKSMYKCLQVNKQHDSNRSLNVSNQASRLATERNKNVQNSELGFSSGSDYDLSNF